MGTNIPVITKHEREKRKAGSERRRPIPTPNFLNPEERRVGTNIRGYTIVGAQPYGNRDRDFGSYGILVDSSRGDSPSHHLGLPKVD